MHTRLQFDCKYMVTAWTHLVTTWCTMVAARGDRYHMVRVRVRVRVRGHSLDHEADVGRFLEEQRPLGG